MSIPHYHVVAAIILHEEHILCVQKGIAKYSYVSYKYEFPGGKVEADESHQTALRRELWEELSLDIHVGKLYHTVFHAYPHFHITLSSYLCSAISIATLRLTEHIDYRWLLPVALPRLDWAAADLPIVTKLARGSL
ncbi:(deoxy)nucleoside triphosphate pyrophosphohydrolase [Parapedobacter koreensis]|uniref:8-oxo-dGTP diphosphatase n=1 Tax=Parapedobacter koreensis TaxID=332977 RepID=A0A1H7QQJ6_9SPHI|nr:(deoxy)nucleoside triphosphate pyrophosphohydrolase [Parapedobacter koreensis]SEL49567.1 8-oxo-dGTP diphosphatase [Parapedobacter koreensis]